MLWDWQKPHLACANKIQPVHTFHSCRSGRTSRVADTPTCHSIVKANKPALRHIWSTIGWGILGLDHIENERGLERTISPWMNTLPQPALPRSGRHWNALSQPRHLVTSTKHIPNGKETALALVELEQTATTPQPGNYFEHLCVGPVTRSHLDCDWCPRTMSLQPGLEVNYTHERGWHRHLDKSDNIAPNTSALRNEEFGLLNVGSVGGGHGIRCRINLFHSNKPLEVQILLSYLDYKP
ncbi:hypothetical protein B0J17DRAFT_766773 [Rhizoctonia solani]|nr:hypothetical protein B0J17DRAFT_766773 [Rhizoctonia solani]